MSDTEVIEGELIDDSSALAISSTAAIEAITRSEIDMQVATAKKYPRSITAFRRKTTEVACVDPMIAGTMFYSLPRDGKKLRGPSIRLAEIAAMSYGNLRYGARITEINDTVIVAQGWCLDMESNIGASVECRRRITKANGQKYSEDMIVVTGNAASSIAIRNAIFKVIPFALVKPVYEQAMKVAAGTGKSIGENRKQWITAFESKGVKPAQLFALLEIKGQDDITLEHMIDLRGLYNAIETGETTVEEAFGTTPAAGGRAKKSSLNDKVATETPNGAKPAAQDSLLGDEPDDVAAAYYAEGN